MIKLKKNLFLSFEFERNVKLAPVSKNYNTPNSYDAKKLFTLETLVLLQDINIIIEETQERDSF